MITKLIESNHYHLWTDALHARSLAQQAKNKWDRGTYVRWTISTSWTVLEMACQDALENEKISFSFQKKINESIENKSLPRLNWGCGVWQKVTKLQELRKDLTHRFASETILFPDIARAEDAICTVREAVKSIYIHCGKEFPEWIEDDIDEGWPIERKCFVVATSSPYFTDKNAIVVSYISKGREVKFDWLSPDTDLSQPVDKLFPHNVGPVTAIRFYRGDEILLEYKYDSEKIRGA